MMAKRLPGILPALTLEEAIETSTIHSVLGLAWGRRLTSVGVPVPRAPPFDFRGRPRRRRAGSEAR